MVDKCLRVGFLLATLVISLHVAAAPRFWTLNGVRFSDGAVASGSFSYDDSTGTVANWNLRVSTGTFTPHTYVPGNSWVLSFPVGPAPSYLYFYSFDLGLGGLRRVLTVVLLAPLDGNVLTAPIDEFRTHESLEGYDESSEYYEFLEARGIRAGSLVQTSGPPPVTIVRVDEFYHAGLRRYFITASAAEMHDLDTGVHPGWVRTGESFKAYAAGSSASGSINPVCRYYGSPLQGLDSHFYSAQIEECFEVFWKFPLQWRLESDNVFQADLPDMATGACPLGAIPVYRLWNQRANSNHRYTTTTAIKAQMLAAGYLAEGYGPDGVAMCAVQ